MAILPNNHWNLTRGIDVMFNVCGVSDVIDRLAKNIRRRHRKIQKRMTGPLIVTQLHCCTLIWLIVARYLINSVTAINPKTKDVRSSHSRKQFWCSTWHPLMTDYFKTINYLYYDWKTWDTRPRIWSFILVLDCYILIRTRDTINPNWYDFYGNWICNVFYLGKDELLSFPRHTKQIITVYYSLVVDLQFYFYPWINQLRNACNPTR